MKALKNTHLMLAALIAPILALIAYFAVDYVIGEKPRPAEAGNSYPLVEKPDCRYSSGHCGLKNGDFELTVTFSEQDAGRVRFRLESVHELDGVLLAVIPRGEQAPPPVAMRADGDSGRQWLLEADVPYPGEDRLRVAASARQSVYFGEASTAFMTAPGP
jgi:hypothetical protein